MAGEAFHLLPSATELAPGFQTARFGEADGRELRTPRRTAARDSAAPAQRLARVTANELPPVGGSTRRW